MRCTFRRGRTLYVPRLFRATLAVAIAAALHGRCQVDSEPEITAQIARPRDLLAGENADELQALRQSFLDFYLEIYPEGLEKVEDPSIDLIPLTEVRVSRK